MWYFAFLLFREDEECIWITRSPAGIDSSFHTSFIQGCCFCHRVLLSSDRHRHPSDLLLFTLFLYDIGNSCIHVQVSLMVMKSGKNLRLNNHYFMSPVVEFQISCRPTTDLSFQGLSMLTTKSLLFSHNILSDEGSEDYLQKLRSLLTHLFCSFETFLFTVALQEVQTWKSSKGSVTRCFS
jgi:hypothetical protein